MASSYQAISLRQGISPPIIFDKIGYVRDKILNNKEKLQTVDEIEYPLLYEELYYIEVTIYYVYNELSDSIKEHFINYIIDLLKDVNLLTNLKKIVTILDPFVSFLGKFFSDISKKLTYDILVMSYISGCYDYISHKYQNEFKKYDIIFPNIWYESIFEKTSITSILIDVLYGYSKNYQKQIDDKFKLCNIKINFMIPLNSGKSCVILNLPECFTIKIIRKYAIKYGLCDANMIAYLYMKGGEEIISDNTEIRSISGMELFCIHQRI